MTCIVGIKEKNKVYIGGDSAAVADLSVSVRTDTKVFKNGKFLIGYAGSFRLGQIMRFHFKPPKHEKGKSDYEYMCVDFIKKMQKTFAESGFDGENRRQEKQTSGQMLVAYRGELYEIYEDYQVGISADPYNSIGCGSDLALGALYTLHKAVPKMPAEQKVAIALDAASTYSGGVLPPYNILSV